MILNPSPPQINFQKYLYRKPQPNLSIKLQPVEQQVRHTFECQCEMCKQYDGKKILELLNEKTEVINRKIREKVQDSKVPSEYFLEILKKLVLPHHKIVKRGVDIYIPEICFFKDGESKGLFMNKEVDDFTIKKIHKNGVNPGLIQRVLNQRRRQYKEDLKKRLGISDRRPLTMQKSLSTKKQPQAPVQQKDVIIIKYTDGFESMMPQTQFIMLTLRRKQDPVWKTIETIRNNITVNDELNNMFFVKYEKNSVKYANLLQRARLLARIYAQNVIPGEGKYISAEEQNDFSLQLLKKDKKSFAEYVVYRIVAFIEYFYDEQIVKLSCKILVNEINKPYLVDVTNYKKRTLIRFTWTNDTYKKKLDEQEKKLFINKAIEITEQLQEKSSAIKELMQHKYHQMKNKYGISLEESDNEEETKNNMFWKKMHPEFGERDLSEVLMSEKHITVNEFKRKYLGFKEEKKPLVKEFGTHMIKVLHKTTPKLKVAGFHDISFKPNESGYFSSRRPNTCSFTKRLSFSAITTPRKHSMRNSSNVQSAVKTQKSQRMKSSRTPTSATYRKTRKSGCHLHLCPGQESMTSDFLNFHK